MRRGTTEPITFTVPFDTQEIKTLNIAFSQMGEVVLEKSLSDVSLNGNEILLNMTQEDTLALHHRSMVFIQLRVLKKDGSAHASDVERDYVDEILRDGVLQ